MKIFYSVIQLHAAPFFYSIASMLAAHKAFFMLTS